jgi:hypothetical protein
VYTEHRPRPSNTAEAVTSALQPSEITPQCNPHDRTKMLRERLYFLYFTFPA